MRASIVRSNRWPARSACRSGDSHPLLAGSWTHDWQSDPFSRGAYSYAAVGGSGAAAELARPLDRTIFFAGEATSSDQTGTVAGAIESGKRAASEVLRARGLPFMR